MLKHKQPQSNAVTHGIFVSPVVLRNENNQEFLKLEQEYTEYYSPVGPAERKLIEEMSVCEWRQRRVWTTETAGIDLQMDLDAKEIEKKFNRIDEPVRTAIALKNLADNSSFLELMHRYETRFSRQYDRALRRLLELQDRRRRDGQVIEMKKPKEILQNETEGLVGQASTPAAGLQTRSSSERLVGQASAAGGLKPAHAAPPGGHNPAAVAS
jgi:hypothetical protein